MGFLPPSERKYRRSPRSLLLPEKHRDVSGQFDRPEDRLGGASYWGAVFNLSTTIIGAGIMALPATLKQLGLIPGLIMIVLGATLTSFSIETILKFSRASKSATYSGLVADAFGVSGRNLLQVCVVLNNLGLLIVYMIIIGDVLSGTGTKSVHHSGLIEEWMGQHWWTSRAFLMLCTTLFVFAPLISLRQLDSLRYTSALSVGLAIVFVAITAGITTVKLVNGSIEIPQLVPKLDGLSAFWRLFTTIPVIVTAYICHHNMLFAVHPIENELVEPGQMKSIVRTSLMLCVSVYMATSLFGFLLFGEGTMDDILANFDGDLRIPYSSALNDLVRASYGIHLMLVFPIVFFSLRLNLHGLLCPHSVAIAYDNHRRFYLLTAFLMGLIFLGANFVPSIWDVFEFTGATTAVSIGFIFPAAVALRDSHRVATKKDKAVSWVMIMLAVTSSMAAISSEIDGILSSGGS
ncbi:hypothetical protein SAY87_010767 [Trapa incisa]|uniref:Amino acid transporter transmembrane domain-containing protein n=1 Tax=Trapa incisa TaxID=236973 RepID=A0AAN7GEM9_9MYRT|nr:hypothetical protein SAY87_010767 [Trapa incisa]